MGLLDVFNSAEGQQALGLLAAAGPRADGAGFGQRLMEGINSGRAMANAQMQQQMQQLQFMSAMRKSQLINQAIESSQGGVQPGSGLSGTPGAPSDPSAGMAPSGAGPTMGGAGGGGGWTNQKIDAFNLTGDPGLMAAAKGAQERQLSGQTDIGKLMVQANIDPNSQLGRQLTQQAIAKSNYQAPTRLGEGAYNDPLTGVQGLPTAAPSGYINKRDPVTGAWSTEKVAGGIGAVQSSATALASGKNAVEPATYIDPVTGKSYGTNKLAVATAGQGAGPAPVSPGGSANDRELRTYAATENVGADPIVIKREMATISNDIATKPLDPSSKAILQAHLVDLQNQLGKVQQSPSVAAPIPASATTQAGAMQVAPAPGFNEGQTNLQNELSKKWTTLSADNAQAQTTKSYLGQISDLANKAVVGPMSDKLQYVNGLLGASGVSQKALDATTANNLLDKYSNQIITRLGQGGLGTDSARQMLQAAYPNSHMTKDAIQEAVGNLSGANSMLQAKASLLAPLANGRDAQNYNTKEVTFDQTADPLLFQNAQKYLSISNPSQRKAFAAQVLQRDPQFISKLSTLENIGVKF